MYQNLNGLRDIPRFFQG